MEELVFKVVRALVHGGPVGQLVGGNQEVLDAVADNFIAGSAARSLGTGGQGIFAHDKGIVNEADAVLLSLLVNDAAIGRIDHSLSAVGTGVFTHIKVISWTISESTGMPFSSVRIRST